MPKFGFFFGIAQVVQDLEPQVVVERVPTHEKGRLKAGSVDHGEQGGTCDLDKVSVNVSSYPVNRFIQSTATGPGCARNKTQHHARVVYDPFRYF